MSELPPQPESPDTRFIQQELEAATMEQRSITDTAARMIASQWHGGQASALYSLTSSGAIHPDRVLVELLHTYEEADSDLDRRALNHLAAYVLEHGKRKPVEGWSRLWGTPEA